MMFTVLLLVALGTSRYSEAQTPPAKKRKINDDCVISKHDYMPVVLSATYNEILHPPVQPGTAKSVAEKKVISIPHGSKITISCTAKLTISATISATYTPSTYYMTMVCNNGDLSAPPGSVGFKDLVCVNKKSPKDPQSVIKKTSTKTKEIGFEAGSHFIPLIKITETNTGFYSYHKLLTSVLGGQIGPRSAFLEGTCTINGISANNYYERESQQQAINQILGLPPNSYDYVYNPKNANAAVNKDIKGRYLIKGHLSPFADFFYLFEKKATNICDNIAPQWQSINNGNWKRVEAYVRDTASKNGDLTVYTGTHQVATIMAKELYLASRKQLPVPKYYWKFVHDVNDKTVVFITANNPYEGDMNTERTSGVFRFCKGACGSLKQLKTDDFNNRKKGLTECCELNPQIQVELGLPAFNSKALLSKL